MNDFNNQISGVKWNNNSNKFLDTEMCNSLGYFRNEFHSLICNLCF